MKRLLATLARTAALASGLAGGAAAQHVQATPVAVDPSDPDRVWVCNRDNDSVSCIDVVLGVLVAEVPVGVMPRSLAFDAAGTTLFVANQRGNIPRSRNFLTPFLGDGTEERGTVSVIDPSSFSVTDTLDEVGTEPVGLAVAPNGAYFAVTGFRSATVKFFDTQAPYAELASIEYDWNLNRLPTGVTYTDADADGDFVADLSQPRFFSITSSSERVFVSHGVSPWVSVLDLTLVGGQPTGVVLAKKIALDDYPFPKLVFDHAPGGSPVQTAASQGLPRFLGSVALSADGTRAVVPHLLANVNHDVNHTFGGLAGDFANRLYPALTVLDAANLSYGEPGDTSRRLHHELADPLDPAAQVHFGGQGVETADGVTTLGGRGNPVLGGTIELELSGIDPGADFAFVVLGTTEVDIPLPPSGTLLCLPKKNFFMPGGAFARPVPNDPDLIGAVVCWQAWVLKPPTYDLWHLSNGTRTILGTQGYGDFGDDKLGHRPGHPEAAVWHGNDRVLVLGRASEDLFLYDASGSELRLMTVFPPRHGFVERTPLDTTTPLGDLPLGFAVADDPDTGNDDALVYVANEVTRTLSVLRVDWATGVITQERPQIGTLAGGDAQTLSQRIGLELFEDASRAQTAGRFNNSCGSCHYEGGDDRLVWQRAEGPRSTLPLYGGIGASGRLLWKSVRLHMGETGPMFAGENGGTGVFNDIEQQALIDVHESFPVPLNPSIDPLTGQLSPLAALGQDLFFGTNETTLNPLLRSAGCAECHPKLDPGDMFGEPERLFTADKIPSPLTNTPGGLETNDPACMSLAENLIADGFRDVNTGVNVDEDGFAGADVDRNNDGIDDRESYEPQNADAEADFERDDANSWPCPENVGNPGGRLKQFTRSASHFTVPTKLGVFASGPYFHDHVASSLRALLDPALQSDQAVLVDYDKDGNPANDVHPLYAKYGDPSFPTANKVFNDAHDIRGNELFAVNPSQVQLNLRSGLAAVANGVTLQEQIDADIEAILAFLESL